MFTLLAISDTSIGVWLSLVLTGLVVAMARMIHTEDYRWKNLFVEILKLQKAAGVEKEPSPYVTPLDQQILDKGKSRYTPEQWAELMKSNGAKNGTGKNDTDQAPTGAAALPGGTAPYWHTACEEAARACLRYGSGYSWDISREGNGYRWQLVPSAGKVELPRLNRSNLWHEHDYPYQVMVSRGDGSTPEPFVPKTPEDHKKVDELLLAEEIKLHQQDGESDYNIDEIRKENLQKHCTGNAIHINGYIQDLKKEGKLRSKDISDGYHTFQELYDMRLALTIGMMRSILAYNDHVRANCVKLWRSQLHKDGTMFDRMFIVGMSDVPGDMITFHYHNEHWDKFNFCDTLDKAPEWDGHTDKDVIERLLAI